MDNRAMTERATLDVKPIYGWGWVIAGEHRFEEPQPFSMILRDNQQTRWEGIVQTEGHEFEGMSVTLSQRHLEWDGTVNVEVQPIDGDSNPSFGYAMIERPPLAR
jgi:hypothetical protein